MQQIFPGLFTFVWILWISGQNLALGKPATQISNYLDFKNLAGCAVDGTRNTDWYANTCSSTNVNIQYPPPWWQVDLEREYLVKRIVITNRGDCCRQFDIDFILMYNNCSCRKCEGFFFFPAERLRKFNVGLGNNKCGRICEPTLFPSCQFVETIQSISISISCNKQGRYVTVSLTEPGILTLCEVEVYGGKPCSTTRFINCKKECS